MNSAPSNISGPALTPNERKRMWAANNRDKVKATMRRRNSDPKVKERKKAWAQSNRETKNRSSRKRYQLDPSKVDAANKRWSAKNPDKIRQKSRAARKRIRENINACYIAQILGVKASILPPGLIEAKRAQLRAVRKIRSLKKTSPPSTDE